MAKTQLPEGNGRKRPKNFRESGTAGETGFSERSWAVHRSGKGFLKGFHLQIEKRQAAVQSEHAEFQGGVAR